MRSQGRVQGNRRLFTRRGTDQESSRHIALPYALDSLWTAGVFVNLDECEGKSTLLDYSGLAWREFEVASYVDNLGLRRICSYNRASSDGKADCKNSVHA